MKNLDTSVTGNLIRFIGSDGVEYQRYASNRDMDKMEVKFRNDNNEPVYGWLVDDRAESKEIEHIVNRRLGRMLSSLRDSL